MSNNTAIVSTIETPETRFLKVVSSMIESGPLKIDIFNPPPLGSKPKVIEGIKFDKVGNDEK